MRDYDALARYVAGRETMPFRDGSENNDCCAYLAGAIAAQTGVNPLHRAGLRWTTARGGRRVIKRLGGLGAALDSVLRPIPLSSAHRGDGGLVEGERAVFVVLIEDRMLSAPGDQGLVRYPRSRLLKAWSAE